MFCLLPFLHFFLIMQKLIDFVSLSIVNYRVAISDIRNFQGRLNNEMNLDGWIFLELTNKNCIVLRFENGSFKNEGYVLNNEKVLKVFGNQENGSSLFYKESPVKGIVDLQHGSRFEGLIFKQNDVGIPFGFGEMYDDEGMLCYQGIVLNWKRFGYGMSYHNNGLVEYVGYWCDDKRCGPGKLYNRKGILITDCNWYNGMESTCYKGDGEEMYFGFSSVILGDNIKRNTFDVSWYLNLESIEIGNNSFKSVQTFKIDGLEKLRRVKINRESFTKVVESDWNSVYNEVFEKANDLSKSFHILNCNSLESIEIGEHSFSDCAGQFELRNLPVLQSLKIGQIGQESFNFYYCSFELKGTKAMLLLL